MEKELLEQLINKGLSTRKIANQIGKSQCSVKYWLKKFELKTVHQKCNSKEYGDYKICFKCKENLFIDKFYNKKNKLNGYSYCKICFNKLTIEKQRLLKKKCIEYKGGKCVVCGYNKYEGSMDFHHINPLEKDFNISRAKNKKFDSIKNELDKCVLLCNRCHREVEGGYTILTEKQKASN